MKITANVTVTAATPVGDMVVVAFANEQHSGHLVLSAEEASGCAVGKAMSIHIEPAEVG